MMHFLRRFLKPKYETLNRIEIDATKIAANFSYLKELQPGAEIFPVLKANAYGHGLKEMCQILNNTTARMVVVDSYPEAQIAYRFFKGKVLILGEMPLGAYRHAKLKRTEFVVYNENTLRYLARYGKKIKIHLFFNSGMNREGIKDMSKFIEENRTWLDKVEVIGLCSHLASADSRSILNSAQEDAFLSALDSLRLAGYFPRWVHLGNSASIFWADNKLLTAFRPGLALFGYDPFVDGEEAAKPLRPALEVFSHVVSVQELSVNDSVSYNETYRATKTCKIATIPFGYYEGLDRRLSNRAEFLVDGQERFWAKIAGRVCMNLSSLELDNANVQVGDEVQVVSSDPDDPNSVAGITNLMETIPYEFLVKLQTNIRRQIINPVKNKKK